MSNPIVEAIEEKLLSRPTFRRVRQLTSGATAEVISDYDPERRRCKVRYTHPVVGTVEQEATVVTLDGVDLPYPKAGDRVWLQFLGGDPSLPVITQPPLTNATRMTSAASLPWGCGA